MAAPPVLPWMRVPIAIGTGKGTPLADVCGLNIRLCAALTSLSYLELFPVQTTLWNELAGGCSTCHDLCVAAPTGSGKTLAYALPVVNALAASGTTVHRLRALIVLPTGDLALQVHNLVSTLCNAVGLSCALAAARSGVAAEAADLVGTEGSGVGGADVLVATPGRLMAHLAGTAGFSLDFLRFLVVDESDRLLRQSYQEWLPTVLQHLTPANGHHCQDWDAGLAQGAGASCHLPYASHRCVKLIVSATLSKDPSKLQRLALHCPRYIAASAEDHRYHLPSTLQEWKVVVPAPRKPVALVSLLHDLAGQSVVVFTASLDTTHKLFLMLEAAANLPEKVVEFSSRMSAAKRAHNLNLFKTGAARVLVASDAMARGMDVEGVQNVVNYDAPVYAKTYVHRAGRTARAGMAGKVITLLRTEDVHHFKQMLRKADNKYVRDYKLSKESMDRCTGYVESALEQMTALLEAEAESDGVIEAKLAPKLTPKQAAAAAAAAARAPTPILVVSGVLEDGKVAGLGQTVVEQGLGEGAVVLAGGAIAGVAGAGKQAGKGKPARLGKRQRMEAASAMAAAAALVSQ